MEGTIRVERVWDNYPDTGWAIRHSAKSKTGERTIEAPDILIEALAAGKDEHEARREALGDAYQLEHGPLVYCTETGAPWYPYEFTKQYLAFRDGAGFAGLRFQDLRHSALSMLLRRGHGPKVVQEIAGHHSVAYTMDTYCWTERRERRAAANDIDGAL